MMTRDRALVHELAVPSEGHQSRHIGAGSHNGHCTFALGLVQQAGDFLAMASRWAVHSDLNITQHAEFERFVRRSCAAFTTLPVAPNHNELLVEAQASCVGLQGAVGL